MIPRNPHRYADRIVFWTCAVIFIGLYTDAVYVYGKSQGQVLPKVCATVPGQIVISSTEGECTYANAYGRARTTRRAG